MWHAVTENKFGQVYCCKIFNVCLTFLPTPGVIKLSYDQGNLENLDNKATKKYLGLCESSIMELFCEYSYR